MAYYTSDEILEGFIKINGTSYTLQEIRYGSNLDLIWPLNLSYEIVTSTVALHYSAGEVQILADGSNYAYATADIKEYRNGVYVRTLPAETLTPTALSGTHANRFHIEGAKVLGYDRGTTEANVGTAANPRGYYCTASFRYLSSEAVTGYTIQQQYNIIEDDSQYEDNYNAYEAALSSETVPSTGGDITVSTSQAGYERITTLVWTTGEESYRTQQVWFSKNPTAISVTPSSGVTVNLSQKKITFPSNSTTSDKDYSVRVSYTEQGETRYEDFDVTVLPAGIEYETPVISVTYPLVSGQNYHIPATGGTVFPTVNFSQRWKYTTDASYTNSRKMTGTITDGAQSGTATDGTRTVTFTMSYDGANVNYGGVQAPNRGTNEYTESVYAEVEVTATGGGGLESNSPIIDVKQQANVPVGEPEEISVSYYMTGLKVVFRNGGGRTSTSAADVGDISYTECKKKYKERVEYTTGQKKTSDWLYSDVTPTYETDLDGARISGSTVITTARGKDDTASISGSVVASFGGSTSSYTIYQAGTQKTYALTSNYDESLGVYLYLPAYASTVTPSFVGIIQYDNGSADDRDTSPSVDWVSGNGISGRITRSGLTISSENLGTTPQNEVETTFNYRWHDHTSARTSIKAIQVANEPESYGTLTLSASAYTIAASGTGNNRITFTPSCTVTWTSGEPSELSGGYTYSIASYGNSGKRDYTLSGNQLSVGSLGTNKVTSEKTTVVRVSHSDAGSATVSLTEAVNEPNYGTIQVHTDTGTYRVLPSAFTLRFEVSCPITWDSGSPGELGTSDFSFSWQQRGNKDIRTYTLGSVSSDGWKTVTFGSLGTNDRDEVYSILRASHSEAGYKDTTLTEYENKETSRALEVSWSIGTVPSYGGYASIGIASAKLRIYYTSGANNPQTVSAAQILNNTEISSGSSAFTFTHTSGSSTARVSAYANEGSSPSERSCTLTATYGGKTASTTVTQQPVAYRTKVQTTSGIINAYLRNADSDNRHTFNYTVTADGVASTGTATFPVGDDEWRIVGGSVASGHILTVVVDKQDNHTILRP